MFDSIADTIDACPATLQRSYPCIELRKLMHRAPRLTVHVRHVFYCHTLHTVIGDCWDLSLICAGHSGLKASMAPHADKYVDKAVALVCRAPVFVLRRRSPRSALLSLL